MFYLFPNIRSSWHEKEKKSHGGQTLNQDNQYAMYNYIEPKEYNEFIFCTINVDI